MGWLAGRGGVLEVGHQPAGGAVDAEEVVHVRHRALVLSAALGDQGMPLEIPPGLRRRPRGLSV